MTLQKVTSKNKFLKMPKWSQDCAAQLKLEELMKNGRITADSKPSDIKSQFNEFDGFSLDLFRTHFNKTKAKLGLFRKYILKCFYLILLKKNYVLLIYI